MNQDPTTGRVGAFFDVDHTLIEVNSGRKWVEYLWKTHRISVPEALRSIWWLAKYRLSLLDYEAMTTEIVGSYAGTEVESLEREVEAWFGEEIAPFICREGREAVERHRSQGHVVALATSGVAMSVRPLQRILGIDHLLCTEIEVENGRLTGGYSAPAAFAEGKAQRIRDFARAQGIDLGRSYFYTDSYSDRPSLEIVGEPRVVNPDPRLRRWSIKRGWSFERWSA